MPGGFAGTSCKPPKPRLRARRESLGLWQRGEPAGDVDHIFLCKMMLHAADISNPAKPLPAYIDWTDRVLAEFYHQGDEERKASLPVSTFYDRSAPNVS